MIFIYMQMDDKLKEKQAILLCRGDFYLVICMCMVQLHSIILHLWAWPLGGPFSAPIRLV